MNRTMNIVFLVYYGYPSRDICPLSCLETNKEYERIRRCVILINSIIKSVDTTINRKIMLCLVHIILQIGTVMFVQAQSKYDSIDISIRGFMAEKKIPGFAACIVKDGAIAWSKSYGQADIQNNVPMSLDGIMNIGSISKTFAASCYDATLGERID